MKKTVILAITLLISGVIFSQKMMTRTGEIKFDATVPGALDPVIANNSSVSSLFDKTTGDLVVQAMVKSFKFKSPLMEEHFNENYMESDKLPKASFKGKIMNYNSKEGSYEVEGDLTIHGVTNKVKTKMAVSNEGDKIAIAGSFNVKLIDYKLEVPALANKTLAENAKISIKLLMENK
ncbi:YceI family protein [Flavobacterium sp. RSB2_4_14]|uniref:YceI family protein n=1 Tax=Flavobacterium sp. RSB2_4_14 TaxID=3447665 RepID=UPI003F2F0D51